MDLVGTVFLVAHDSLHKDLHRSHIDSNKILDYRKYNNRSLNHTDQDHTEMLFWVLKIIFGINSKLYVKENNTRIRKNKICMGYFSFKWTKHLLISKIITFEWTRVKNLVSYGKMSFYDFWIIFNPVPFLKNKQRYFGMQLSIKSVL